jgi:hypothetical protein
VKEITKGILIGLITTAIIAGFGYVCLVRENQLRIQIMQRDMDRLSSQVESGNNSLNAIKLFVVSAHPDRNMLPVSSAKKLQRLEPKEIATLAAHIGRYSSATAFSQRVCNDDPLLGSFLVYNEIDQNDLQNYWHMARDQKFNENHEP